MNIGDIVRILSKSVGSELDNDELAERFGCSMQGKILRIDDNIIVEATHGNGKEYQFLPDDLEIINQTNQKMSNTIKLTDRQKALLTAEAIVRIEAGYIDMADGKLTEAGRGAMWAILTEAYAKELTASAKAVLNDTQAKANLAKAKEIIANS